MGLRVLSYFIMTNIFLDILFCFTNSDRYNIITFFVVSFLFASLLLCIAYILSNLKKPNLLKRTEGFETYEFGATSIGNSSLIAINKHFYILGVLFIVFDVELMFLFPWVYGYNTGVISNKSTIIIFLIILMLAFFYEVVSGALN